MKTTLRNTLQTTLSLGIILLPLALAPRAYAQTTAITGITIAGGGARLTGSFRSIGFEFTPTVDLFVSDLGVYDHNQDGLNGAKTVGIFQKTGSILLTSTTVSTPDTLDGLFRYKSIAPITLFAGQTYAVAGQFPQADGDFYLAEASAYTAAGAISYTPAMGAVFNGIGDTLFFDYPSDVITNRNGHFSANFKFTTSGVSAPEPATLSLFALGLAGSMGIARQQRGGKA
jgi:hypothetical protein